MLVLYTPFITLILDSSHRKSKNNDIYHVIDNSNFYLIAIKDWRGKLKLSKNNKVLVSFAWCHNEELKSIFLNVSKIFRC